MSDFFAEGKGHSGTMPLDWERAWRWVASHLCCASPPPDKPFVLSLPPMSPPRKLVPLPLDPLPLPL